MSFGEPGGGMGRFVPNNGLGNPSPGGSFISLLSIFLLFTFGSF